MSPWRLSQLHSREMQADLGTDPAQGRGLHSGSEPPAAQPRDGSGEGDGSGRERVESGRRSGPANRRRNLVGGPQENAPRKQRRTGQRGDGAGTGGNLTGRHLAENRAVSGLVRAARAVRLNRHARDACRHRHRAHARRQRRRQGDDNGEQKCVNRLSMEQKLPLRPPRLKCEERKGTPSRQAQNLPAGQL